MSCWSRSALLVLVIKLSAETQILSGKWLHLLGWRDGQMVLSFWGSAEFGVYVLWPNSSFFPTPGTWTFFEHIECSFPTYSPFFGEFHFFSQKASTCKMQMEYLVHKLSAAPTSLNDLERELDQFLKSTNVCLWDDEKCESHVFKFSVEEVSVHQKLQAAGKVLSLFLDIGGGEAKSMLLPGVFSTFLDGRVALGGNNFSLGRCRARCPQAAASSASPPPPPGTRLVG